MVGLRPWLPDSDGAGRADWVFVRGNMSGQACSCMYLSPEHAHIVTKATNGVVWKCQNLRSCCWGVMDTGRASGLITPICMPVCCHSLWLSFRVPSPFSLGPLLGPAQYNHFSPHSLLPQPLVSSSFMWKEERIKYLPHPSAYLFALITT